MSVLLRKGAWLLRLTNMHAARGYAGTYDIIGSFAGNELLGCMAAPFFPHSLFERSLRKNGVSVVLTRQIFQMNQMCFVCIAPLSNWLQSLPFAISGTIKWLFPFRHLSLCLAPVPRAEKCLALLR